MTFIEQQIVDIIQDGFPIAERPYAILAEKLDGSWTEQSVFDAVESLRASGVIRRIGGVYDSRKLGFVSRLCAGKVPASELDFSEPREGRAPTALEHFAAVVKEIPAITHNYIRSHEYNVWFTVIAENEAAVLAVVRKLEASTELHDAHCLSAKRMFKINTVMKSDERGDEVDNKSSSAVPEAQKRFRLGGRDDIDDCMQTDANAVSRTETQDAEVRSSTCAQPSGSAHLPQQFHFSPQSCLLKVCKTSDAEMSSLISISESKQRTPKASTTNHQPLNSHLPPQPQPLPSDSDKLRIRLLSGDLPHTLTPFEDIFKTIQQSQMSEKISFESFLDAIRDDLATRRTRRLGAILRHQNAGFAYNAMVCFLVCCKQCLENSDEFGNEFSSLEMLGEQARSRLGGRDDVEGCTQTDANAKSRTETQAAAVHSSISAQSPNPAHLPQQLPQNIDSAGAILAANPHVSHCYEREPFEIFPYNIYAMFHAESAEQLDQYISEAVQSLGFPPYAVLHSVRELKKTSYKFFEK